MNVDDLIRGIDRRAGETRLVVVALSGGVDSGLAEQGRAAQSIWHTNDCLLPAR